MTKSDILAAKLTDGQLAALKALSGRRNFEEARALGIHGRTLTSLAELGLIDRKWRTSSLRGGDRWAYRINGFGVIVKSRAEKSGQ